MPAPLCSACSGTQAEHPERRGRILNAIGTPNYEYSLKDHLGNARVTFDSSTGAAAKQTDEYYPFGMVASQTGTIYPENKYLYNEKELQDGLGQYDYGARFYDPVIARFSTMDRFTEKYIGHNPYQYGLNNPIKNIDINGDSVWVNIYVNIYGHNVTQQLYFQKGVAYMKDGTKYTGNDAFVGQVGAALSALRNGGAEGEGLVNDLENRTRSTTIINDLGHRGNKAAPDGSQILWDPNGKDGGPQQGTSSLTRPTFIGLGHEMAHVQDVWNGTVDNGNWFQTGTDANGSPTYKSNAEKYATYIENKLRAENNVPLRTHYSPDVNGSPYEPSRILIRGTNYNRFFRTGGITRGVAPPINISPAKLSTPKL